MFLFNTMFESHAESSAEMAETIKKNFDYIMVTVVDINGIPRCKTFPSRHAPMILKNGVQSVQSMAAYGPRNESIYYPKLKADGFGNGLLIPDPSTLHLVPWLGQNNKPRFCELFCTMNWPTGGPMPMIPRHMALHQLEELDKLGLKMYSAGEYEFNFYKDRVTPSHEGMDMYLPSYIYDYQDLLVNLERCLSQAGVDVEYFNSDLGRGQFEMPLRPQGGIHGPDNSVLLKEGVRQVAKIHGLRGTFMTKVASNNSANGCHFNHSLWTKEGKNAFYDDSKPDKISELCRHWLGGLLHHCSALLALCSPTVNCYRRLHQERTPDFINWNLDSRCVTMRVKNASESNCYIENRLGSSASNPYLLLAGTIAAGLDGIKKKLEPPPRGSNELGKLPNNFQEALEALEEDTVFTEAIGKEFVEWFSQMKRDADLTALKDVDITKNREEDYEKEREEYFDFI